MRVLLIDVNCKNSSTGQIVYDLYTGARKSGHEVAICYGRGKKIKGTNIYKFGLDLETYVHALLARVTGWNGCFSFFSTRRLIKYIECFKPDVIHIHELHAYFVNLRPLLDYIKKKNIKLVWTFHCEYMYTGKCGHAYDCAKWQTECGKCPAVRQYPKSFFFDKTYEMYKKKKELLSDLNMIIVTPSQWGADRVKMSFLKEKEIRVIFNGVDTSDFKIIDSDILRSQLGIDEEQKIVMFVAADMTDENKGAKWVPLIAKQFVSENVFFLMIGGGKYPEPVPTNMSYVGPIYSPKKLAEYYSMADVFLLCSERETFSLTCAEALCCGTPVVGFEAGAPESVFKEPDAIFVKPKSIQCLVDELRKTLLRDGQKKAEISQVAHTLYGKDVMIRKYIELYNEVVGRETK